MGTSKNRKFQGLKKNLKPQFTIVNEDFKILKQRRNLHF